MPLPVLVAGAARMAASGAAKKAASGVAKKAASGVAKKTVATNIASGVSTSPVNSPALAANAKTAGNPSMLSESQQETALRMSRSETNNTEALKGKTESAAADTEQASDPIGDRIRQQLEIRKAQQESEENEEPSDEESQEAESQEEELNQSQESARASMASMASQAGSDLAGKLAKKAIKRGFWAILTSIVGAIVSVISAILTFLAPILLPILIIIFCFALVYNYISEHQISGGYQIMTGQFEKLLIDAANNTPPSNSASSTQK